MSTADEIIQSVANDVLREEVAGLWGEGKYTPMPSSDPAQILINMPYVSVPTVSSPTCYICQDPEFAMMGLPLCKPCLACGGHVPADDIVCDVCGADQYELMDRN